MVSFSLQQEGTEPQRKGACDPCDRDEACLPGPGQRAGAGQLGPFPALSGDVPALSSLQPPTETKRISPSRTKAEILGSVFFFWWSYRLFTAPLEKTGQFEKQTHTTKVQAHHADSRSAGTSSVFLRAAIRLQGTSDPFFR